LTGPKKMLQSMASELNDNVEFSSREMTISGYIEKNNRSFGKYLTTEHSVALSLLKNPDDFYSSPVDGPKFNKVLEEINYFMSLHPCRTISQFADALYLWEFEKRLGSVRRNIFMLNQEKEPYRDITVVKKYRVEDPGLNRLSESFMITRSKPKPSGRRAVSHLINRIKNSVNRLLMQHDSYEFFMHSVDRIVNSYSEDVVRSVIDSNAPDPVRVLCSNASGIMIQNKESTRRFYEYDEDDSSLIVVYRSGISRNYLTQGDTVFARNINDSSEEMTLVAKYRDLKSVSEMTPESIETLNLLSLKFGTVTGLTRVVSYFVKKNKAYIEIINDSTEVGTKKNLHIEIMSVDSKEIPDNEFVSLEQFVPVVETTKEKFNIMAPTVTKDITSERTMKKIPQISEIHQEDLESEFFAMASALFSTEIKHCYTPNDGSIHLCESLFNDDITFCHVKNKFNKRSSINLKKKTELYSVIKSIVMGTLTSDMGTDNTWCGLNGRDFVDAQIAFNELFVMCTRENGDIRVPLAMLNNEYNPLDMTFARLNVQADTRVKKVDDTYVYFHDGISYTVKKFKGTRWRLMGQMMTEPLKKRFNVLDRLGLVKRKQVVNRRSEAWRAMKAISDLDLEPEKLTLNIDTKKLILNFMKKSASDTSSRVALSRYDGSNPSIISNSILRNMLRSGQASSSYSWQGAVDGSLEHDSLIYYDEEADVFTLPNVGYCNESESLFNDSLDLTDDPFKIGIKGRVVVKEFTDKDFDRIDRVEVEEFLTLMNQEEENGIGQKEDKKVFFNNLKSREYKQSEFMFFLNSYDPILSLKLNSISEIRKTKSVKHFEEIRNFLRANPEFKSDDILSMIYLQSTLQNSNFASNMKTFAETGSVNFRSFRELQEGHSGFSFINGFRKMSLKLVVESPVVRTMSMLRNNIVEMATVIAVSEMIRLGNNMVSSINSINDMESIRNSIELCLSYDKKFLLSDATQKRIKSLKFSDFKRPDEPLHATILSQSMEKFVEKNMSRQMAADFVRIWKSISESDNPII
jgi:hypothetical protein